MTLVVEQPSGGGQPRQQQSARHAKRKKSNSAIYLILGIAVLLYPIFATIYNDYQLDAQARSYSDNIEKIQPSERVAKYLEEAREYNERLARQGHHAMPPEEGVPGFDDYMSTLNAPETNGVIARITIPSIDVDLPVYHTTADHVLYEGAGHMFGSSLPVGGLGTNSVISAHTGMVNATMFDNLPRIKDGADVYIDIMGEKLRYQVNAREVVGPDDYEAVTYEHDKDKLTLVTCTPYGINTDRLLVNAERVPMDEAQETRTSWMPHLSWWMYLDLFIIFVVLAIVAYREWKKRAARKALEREAAELATIA